MRRVTINGDVYAAPFDRLVRPLTPAERDGLRGSIRRVGVVKPVVVYVSPTWGRAVIDGLNRGELSSEIDPDAEVPVVSRGRVSDAEARELALDLNVHRRHLSPEELQAARERRVRRVAATRQTGESLRTIAGLEGVSVAQVRRDLADHKALAENGLEPAPTPGVPGGAPPTVSGVDGKSYPARRPRLTRVNQARRAAELLARVVAQLVRESGATRLEELAASYGVPLGPKADPPRRRKGSPKPPPATRWPALDAVCAVLRELAGGAASG